MTLFDNIKKYSKQRGYNLQTTAEKAGLSKNIIYQYNKGKQPSIDTLQTIAKVLGVSVEDLLGESTSKVTSSTQIDIANKGSIEMTTFENIKKYSKLRKLSLREVATKAGLSENALYRYNQGVEPKYETLKAVADALHVDVSDLSDKYVTNNIDHHPTQIDIANDDVIMTFEGKPIPPEDLELMRRLLRGGQK